jgi:hypothetical protein
MEVAKVSDPTHERRVGYYDLLVASVSSHILGVTPIVFTRLIKNEQSRVNFQVAEIMRGGGHGRAE